MPAVSFSTLMRPQGPLICVPELVGTASQWPFDLPRYSTTLLAWPYCAVSRPITSSIGSSWSAWFCTSQVGKRQDVVAGLGLRLGGGGQQELVAVGGDEVGLHLDLVLVGPGLRPACFITSLPAGTQWSQKPIDSLPAAPAVRICTSGSAAAAAPSLSALRRVTFPLRILDPFPNTAGSSSGPPSALACLFWRKCATGYA